LVEKWARIKELTDENGLLTAHIGQLKLQLVAAERADSPVYNAGRMEGWADVAAQLRKVLDPTDAHHWNLDGLLAEVARLHGGAS
jgi:hypothetical protein